MRSGISRLISPVMIIVSILVCHIAHSDDIYVSLSGDDSNPGSMEQPFATLHRAQEAAREISARGESVRVLIREGLYFMDRPLTLESRDSGTETDRVSYEGYPGEDVILSGGVPLNAQWTEGENGIWQSPIAPEHLDMDQLFVDQTMYRMARFPNHDRSAKFFGGTSGDAIAPERVRTWDDPVGGYMHALHQAMWGSKHYRIVGVNDDASLQLEGGWQENRGGGFDPVYRGGYHNDYLFVENIREELDAPGEWFLDRDAGVLYVKPMPGDDLSSAQLIGAMQKELIVVAGSIDGPVRHVSIINLSFQHTRRVFMEPYERLLRGDWSIARLAAVRLTGTEDCAIRDCAFEDLGGNGILFDTYNRDGVVEGCEFVRLGESPVCLVGDLDAVRSPAIEYSRTLPQDEIDLKYGPQSENYPRQCLIENNLMHDFGLVGKQVAGVFISMSEEITVRHNTIYDCPRAAICINDGCWGGHIIEFNDAFNTVRESGDHGPFNSWGRDRFWKTSYNGGRDIEPFAKERARLDTIKTIHIRNNRFAHPGGHSWGIDLDDGSSNYRVYNNLCLGMGVKLREGFFRSVENNIMIEGFGGFHIWFPDSEDVITRNIIVSDKPYQFIRANPEHAAVIDNNLFFNYGEMPQITGVGDPMTLEQWQARGFDENSLLADPMFLDPARGDYRVAPDSPAMMLGFVNFPMDHFGVTKSAFKEKVARVPRTFVPVRENPTGETTRSEEPLLWMGATLKNLVGEAEKSAAGMGDETGVLCVDIPQGSDAARMGLRTGDVIIGVADSPIDTVQDFMQRLERRGNERVTLTVFNAVERTVDLR